MAQYTIQIEGDELEELQQIVADINQQQPKAGLTEQGYLQQMMEGFLRDRITNAYAAAVKQKPLAELKALLGRRKDLNNGN